jgi:hypothetical protein
VDEELTLGGILGDPVRILDLVEIERQQQVDPVRSGKDFQEEDGAVIADRARLGQFNDLAVHLQNPQPELIEGVTGCWTHLDLADITPLRALVVK